MADRLRRFFEAPARIFSLLFVPLIINGNEFVLMLKATESEEIENYYLFSKS